jgi:hypothetical protein
MSEMKIFVSYSHQNSDWVDENGRYKLIPWLKQQLRRENVVFWTDHVLQNHVGEEYKKNIKENIDDSDIALLLITQDFATSDFILEYELPWIEKAFKQKRIKVIPLLVDRLADIGKRNISWIFELQIIPNEAKPIIDYFENASYWSNIRNSILNSLSEKITTIRNNRNKQLDKEIVTDNSLEKKEPQNKKTNKKKIILIITAIAISLTAFVIYLNKPEPSIEDTKSIDKFKSLIAIGDSLCVIGKLSQALEQYEQAKSIDSTNTLILQKIDTLNSKIEKEFEELKNSILERYKSEYREYYKSSILEDCNKALELKYDKELDDIIEQMNKNSK